MYLNNITEKVNNVKIAERFDASMLNLAELITRCPDPFDLASACFRFGYLQGSKAEKKALKNKAGIH